jgi:hypothetical protein
MLFMLGLAGLGSGCDTEVTVGPQPYVLVADLEVTWGIAGSSDPFLCDQLGIDQWLVTADGPEVRQSNVDCRGDAWSTEGDFFAMPEGNYLVTVEAVGQGFTLALQSADFTLVNTGVVQQLFFDFLPEDFGVVF